MSLCSCKNSKSVNNETDIVNKSNYVKTDIKKVFDPFLSSKMARSASIWYLNYEKIHNAVDYTECYSVSENIKIIEISKDKYYYYALEEDGYIKANLYYFENMPKSDLIKSIKVEMSKDEIEALIPELIVCEKEPDVYQSDSTIKATYQPMSKIVFENGEVLNVYYIKENEHYVVSHLEKIECSEINKLINLLQDNNKI